MIMAGTGVRISVDNAVLSGDLSVPIGARDNAADKEARGRNRLGAWRAARQGPENRLFRREYWRSCSAYGGAGAGEGSRGDGVQGGRPDLTGGWLGKVKRPTILIVGGNDEEAIRLNKLAFDGLGCKKRLVVVEGATHLFEEPVKLGRVATLARDWFIENL